MLLPLCSSSLCADGTFNETLPYFFSPSSPPDLSHYIPTCILSVSGPSVKPLQVYVCQKKMLVAQLPVLPSSTPPADSSAQSISSTSSTPINPNDLPIALCKGKLSCTSHPIALFVSSDHLSHSLCAFTTYFTDASIPKFVSEALSVPC